ncbi:hypothetical protein FE840_014035 [Peteryoungia desertarenae]|uniref:Peptidase M50 n=1 Tax=Peteryoungia desertarenae TaxID=1813451 RepID=A0ABX6QPT0_9HYPH|nr:hypothetical protein [Peteryoungia desertarenae]QLF70563.1 hypothetical protein FE840_014035 [Peteryoungia desertarenae]
MESYQAAIFLLAINLGLLWLLMAFPLGLKTLRVSCRLGVRPEEIWRLMRPSGAMTEWHPSILSATPIKDSPDKIEFSFRQPDRYGEPSRRVMAVDRMAVTASGIYTCDLRVISDSTLDSNFWAGYRESRRVEPCLGGARVTFEQTDSYRGLAFYLFRRLALQRELRALEDHVTGRKGSDRLALEHPLFQMFLALVSTLMLWPFFGLTLQGLMLSSFLTLVIALHEVGHMIAYRAFGHRQTRMIFVPLLGGIAIGGRPYHSRFEVATCALMGPGFSAFLVPILISLHDSMNRTGLGLDTGKPLLVFLLILGAFNLLNLMPMYRFDGGQILRQVFDSQRMLALGSFGITAAIAATGWHIGLPPLALLGALAVFTLLSLIRTNPLRPREELIAMSPAERLVAGFGLYAAVMMHALAIAYACGRLFG